MHVRETIFSEDALPSVQHLDCGDSLAAELAVEWIKQGRAFRGALKSMEQHGTEVWLYWADANGEEHLIGFASLGVTRVPIPLPDGQRQEVGFIPMLGVARSFQSKFLGKGKKYSHWIMESIIEKAREREFRRLCLYVHKDNLAAQRLYEKFGFQYIAGEGAHGNRGMMRFV